MESENLENIKKLISEGDIDIKAVDQALISFIKNDLKKNHCIDNYIGDYPTFLEPVHLKGASKLGDDVLLGPNVYIGDNCEIGNYCEITNTIIFDNVKLGENFKLQNCIIAPDSKLDFNNIKAFNCILRGDSKSFNDLDKITL